MGQRAVTGVQQAGQAAQSKLGTYQDDFQKMLAQAQGQPAAAASPGAAGGGAGASPGGKFKPSPVSSFMIGQGAQGGKYGPPTVQREADLFGEYANADLSRLTADRLSGTAGWTGALSGAQQAGQQAQQLGRGQAGLYSLLGQQSGPGYYGGRGRAIDSYATANSGTDFDTTANAWKGIADAYGLADNASSAAVDKLKAGAANYQALHAQDPSAPSAPADQQPAPSAGPMLPPGNASTSSPFAGHGNPGLWPFGAPAANPGGPAGRRAGPGGPRRRV